MLCAQVQATIVMGQKWPYTDLLIWDDGAHQFTLPQWSQTQCHYVGQSYIDIWHLWAWEPTSRWRYEFLQITHTENCEKTIVHRHRKPILGGGLEYSLSPPILFINQAWIWWGHVTLTPICSHGLPSSTIFNSFRCLDVCMIVAMGLIKCYHRGHPGGS